MSQFLSSQASWIGEAIAAGQLYDLGSYPGMVLNKKGSHSVLGDLYELRNPDTILPILDEYEGCGPPDYLYRRIIIEAKGPIGQRYNSWVYIYQRPISENQRIVSGDYLQRGFDPR